MQTPSSPHEEHDAPVMRAIRAAIVRQFGHPRGVAGRIAGCVMANRSSNRRRNSWVVSLLDVQPGERVSRSRAPGRQAGSSARIENNPGFPDRSGGLELTQQTYEQARRFEAEFVLVNEVTAADPNARAPFRLGLFSSMSRWPRGAPLCFVGLARSSRRCRSTRT
jgi:hypothetical protein